MKYMEGKVIKCVKNRYTILTKENIVYNCKLKGVERLKEIEFSNPISVGDNVDFVVQNETQEGVINKVFPRKNYVIRQSVNLSYKSQILASNIDLSFLIITLKDPKTSLLFIDRYLITTNAYKIPTILIFNKIDIYKEEEEILEKEYKNIYEKIGIECISVSVLKNMNMNIIKDRLQNKTVLLSGHSGVGKSSFINLVDQNFNLKTKEVSEKHKQGIHTTTFSEMFHLKGYNSFIIDTPGIKGFGLVDISKEDLGKYFPEIKKYSMKCKFKNCIHVKEPKCEVLKKLENGDISKSRYLNYLDMLKESKLYRKENYK